MIRKLIFACLVIATLTGCGSGESASPEPSKSGQDSLAKAVSDSIGQPANAGSGIPSAVSESPNDANWQDSLIVRYIRQSDDALVRSLDPAEAIWLFDRTEPTDSARYFVYSIGHDVSDENGSNKRYAVAAWVYLDSAARTLYKYDVVEERLIKWDK